MAPYLVKVRFNKGDKIKKPAAPYGVPVFSHVYE